MDSQRPGPADSPWWKVPQSVVAKVEGWIAGGKTTPPVFDAEEAAILESKFGGLDQLCERIRHPAPTSPVANLLGELTVWQLSDGGHAPGTDVETVMRLLRRVIEHEGSAAAHQEYLAALETFRGIDPQAAARMAAEMAAKKGGRLLRRPARAVRAQKQPAVTPLTVRPRRPGSIRRRSRERRSQPQRRGGARSSDPDADGPGEARRSSKGVKSVLAGVSASTVEASIVAPAARAGSRGASPSGKRKSSPKSQGGHSKRCQVCGTEDAVGDECAACQEFAPVRETVERTGVDPFGPRRRSGAA